MPAMKKGKLWVIMQQVNIAEQVHTLWPVKFCPMAGANLFSLMCKLLRGNKISSDHLNDIVINTPNSEIVLDCWIMTCNGSVTRVDFLQASNDKRAVSATAPLKKNVNDLHVELGHPSEVITRSTAKGLGIQVTGTFKPCEDCALVKAKQCSVSKKAAPCLQILEERLFFDISSPSTPTFGGKHHWLLVINDCSDYCWSFFLKEKSDLAQTMLGLVNNLKIKLNLQVQCLRCNNAGKNQPFERTCKQEGLGIDFKYTAPGTPQQNGCIKCKFATLFHEQKKCVTIDGTHHTSLKGLFYIFGKPNFFLFFFFCSTVTCQWTQHQIIFIPVNGFFCFLEFFIMAIFLCLTAPTYMSFLSKMVADFIEFFIFTFCFFIIFFFITFIFGASPIARYVAILTTFLALLLILFVICTQCLLCFNFFSSFLFLIFSYLWFNFSQIESIAKASSPVAVRPWGNFQAHWGLHHIPWANYSEHGS